VTAAREAISLAPNSAPAHYYLGLNLGQSARGKRTGAFRILREMERALLTAAQLDCEFDYGGPDRSLGMLYLQAPPWPVSIGNRPKARAHLERAVQLDPGYPENRIALAEAFARWGETKSLGRELGLIEELLPKVRARFGGALWEQSWQEWEDRFHKLRRTHEQLVASPRASPGERGAKPVK
jgi:tetratricopeptide (TPR) repeat protein